MGLFKRAKSSDTKAAIQGKSNGHYDGSAEHRNGAPTKTPPPQSNNQSQPAAAQQNPPIPNVPLPAPPNPETDPAGYLRSIYAVRQQTQKVMAVAKRNELKHFKVDVSKLTDTANYVVSIIKVLISECCRKTWLTCSKRDYAPNFASIPPHGRWQHFDVGGTPRIDKLMKTWTGIDSKESCRRLLDLFLVSVLLDAGAGSRWQYKAQNGRMYKRSEGLAVASLEMFQSGLFSSEMALPTRVDGKALKALTTQHIMEGLQVSSHNPMDGLEGRTQLLVQLGHAMDNQALFGQDGRPGNMLGQQVHLASTSTTNSGQTTFLHIPQHTMAQHLSYQYLRSGQSSWTDLDQYGHRPGRESMGDH
jgi:hypothetical protein